MQHDSMSCGATCLQMICEAYGKIVCKNTIENLCSASTEGVSLSALSDAATNLGFEANAVTAITDELHDLPLPCILHWNQNHFVVLYKIKKGRKFYIADPGKGLVTYSREEFESHWISTSSDGGGCPKTLKQQPCDI